MTRKVIAIVPSAGLGKRFSSSIKKTFASLGGIPLLIHTLRRVCDEKAVNGVIPVLAEEDIELGRRLAKEHGLGKIRQIARGGKERQDSVYSALRLIAEDREASDAIVLVHDGARPFIPGGMIEELVMEIDKGYDGAIPGLPVKETLKLVNADRIISSTVDRELLWSIQTPQAFPFKVIKEAYHAAFKDGFYATDDSALVERNGGKVRIIMGSPYNIKVTTPEDLCMMESFLMKRETTA